jgi:muconolactone delta-isomerase
MSLNSLARIRYRASRTSRDLKALSTGNWRRIVRRAKNKVVGRALARSGMFRRLWR